MNHYDVPLRDLYGWILLATFVLPMLWAIGIILVSTIAGFLIVFVEGGQAVEQSDRVSVKLQEYDMDEDY